MYRDGYTQITNIDISDICIEKMKSEAEKKEMNMECIIAIYNSFMYGCYCHEI